MAEKPKMDIHSASQDEIVVQYAPLVKRIAYHLVARLPSSVTVDDMIQAGMIGLLEASRNYDARQGAAFETYASIRIRGSMLDELRKNDWAPKSVHRKIRQVMEAVRNIENESGRDARDEEVAKAMNLSLDEYYKILQDASILRIFSFDELGVDEDVIGDDMSEHHPSPLDDIQRSDFKSKLADAVASLPERERLIISLYYDNELNLREIGSVLGVSESRVSQLLSQALIRLRSRMSEWR